MSTFEFFTSGEAYAASRPGVADRQSIIGRNGADLDRVDLNHVWRGKPPREQHDARGGMRQHGKPIERITRTREEENDPEVPWSTVTVHYADGTSEYLPAGSYLCVERPIGGRG